MAQIPTGKLGKLFIRGFIQYEGTVPCTFFPLLYHDLLHWL